MLVMPPSATTFYYQLINIGYFENETRFI